MCTRLSLRLQISRPQLGYRQHLFRSTRMASVWHQAGDFFFLDEFALRQFNHRDPGYSGTRVYHDEEDFVQQVHKQFQDQGGKLVEGYASFCKHVFIKNFTGATLGAMAITASNQHLLQSGYTSRRPEELAVLSRWFGAADVEPVPQAKMLDIILYSREQLVKEYNAMPEKGDPGDLPQVPWGIISVKVGFNIRLGMSNIAILLCSMHYGYVQAQDEDFETPMQPMTMMRNALGAEEGGSGVRLDKVSYQASVKYWQGHAPIVAGQKPGVA